MSQVYFSVALACGLISFSGLRCFVHDAGEEGHQGSKVKVLTAKKMLVMDCRSYSAAIANRAKGGGCESPGM